MPSPFPELPLYLAAFGFDSYPFHTYNILYTPNLENTK